MITIVALDEAELETFLAFASQVDNGEAATCALAIHRGLPLATDDRKARRLLLQQALPLQLYSTLDLLKLWAETCKLGAWDLALILMAVRDRGSFVPPRGDPLRGWWETSISAASIEEF